MPAIQALAAVERAWSAWPGLRWGPGGSVGFELASGLASVGNDSDLDLVVLLDRAIPRSEAHTLWKQLPHQGPARMDVQLQTPAGAVALSEYAMGAGSVMLRSANGARLTRDPWAEAPRAEVA
ncbi:Phosphoribosyl-dephospho-CoA transferase (fragment) [Thiomonas sp. X19]